MQHVCHRDRSHPGNRGRLVFRDLECELVDSSETIDAELGPLCRSLSCRLPAPPAAGKGTGAYNYNLLPHLGSQNSDLFCLLLLMLSLNCDF